MNQDPITTRFLEVYDCLKTEGRVRSARQFALSIGTYPQSFNDIQKGRREATLCMVQKIVEVYGISAHYLLTGQGSQHHHEIFSLDHDSAREIFFIQAHQFSSYAQARSQEYFKDLNWTKWSMPAQLINDPVEIAFQCNTDRVSGCISRGDILFSRMVPRDSWKSNLSSKRIYILTTVDNVYIVGIENVDLEGITLRTDDRNIPSFISYDEICEVWSPISKWSNKVLMDLQPQDPGGGINELLSEQNESIKTLSLQMQRWMSQLQVESSLKF